MSTELRIVCLGNAKPRFFPKTDKNKLAEHIEDMEEAPWDGPKCRTKIKFSPDSSLSQCLSEAKNIWKRHARNPNGRLLEPAAPGWIAGNDPVLVEALRQEFQIPKDSVRAYEEDGL